MKQRQEVKRTIPGLLDRMFKEAGSNLPAGVDLNRELTVGREIVGRFLEDLPEVSLFAPHSNKFECHNFDAPRRNMASDRLEMREVVSGSRFGYHAYIGIEEALKHNGLIHAEVGIFEIDPKAAMELHDRQRTLSEWQNDINNGRSAERAAFARQSIDEALETYDRLTETRFNISINTGSPASPGIVLDEERGKNKGSGRTYLVTEWENGSPKMVIACDRIVGLTLDRRISPKIDRTADIRPAGPGTKSTVEWSTPIKAENALIEFDSLMDSITGAISAGMCNKKLR